MKGYLRRILPFSAVDGPGNRTVLFFQGCGFHCDYCHNPETIPAGADCSTEEVFFRTPEDVVGEVLKYQMFISGVTISGGEATLQPEFLISLVKILKKHQLNILIDTNGDFDVSYYNRLTPWIDGYMLDIKAIDQNCHKQLTGRDNTHVLENMIRMAKDHKLYEVRTVVVPDQLDNEGTVSAVSKCLEPIDPDIRYKLIRFRPMGVKGKYQNIRQPDNTEMELLENIATSNGMKNVIIV